MAATAAAGMPHRTANAARPAGDPCNKPLVRPLRNGRQLPAAGLTNARLFGKRPARHRLVETNGNVRQEALASLVVHPDG